MIPIIVRLKYLKKVFQTMKWQDKDKGPRSRENFLKVLKLSGKLWVNRACSTQKNPAYQVLA
jgi:hypothetical protein